MSASNLDIESLITALERALAEAEEVATRFRHALTILRGAPVQPSANGSLPIAPIYPARVLPSGGSLPLLQRNDTNHSAAIKALRAMGRPMHIKEIVRNLIAADFKNKDEKSLQGSLTRTLDRAAHDGDTFVKTAPATYGLIEWGSQGQMTMLDGEKVGAG